MAGQLIPPPELRSPPDHLVLDGERVWQWFQLVGTCEQFLLAGLRDKVGPAGDVNAAYRRWYEREWELRDRHRKNRLEELQRRGHDDVA